MARERDEPKFANDVDGSQIPSIETTPGTIPQTPKPGEAPSRGQAKTPPPAPQGEGGGKVSRDDLAPS